MIRNFCMCTHRRNSALDVLRCAVENVHIVMAITLRVSRIELAEQFIKRDWFIILILLDLLRSASFTNVFIYCRQICIVIVGFFHSSKFTISHIHNATIEKEKESSKTNRTVFLKGKMRTTMERPHEKTTATIRKVLN